MLEVVKEIWIGKEVGNTPAPPSAGWKPHKDWWDIASILKANPEYDKIFLLLNVESTYTNAYFPYMTSDGGVHAAGEVHTWDVAQDKSCDLGYKTRWVMIKSGGNHGLDSFYLMTNFVLYALYPENAVVNGSALSLNGKVHLQAVDFVNGKGTWQNSLSGVSTAPGLIKLGGTSIKYLNATTLATWFEGCFVLSEIPELDLTYTHLNVLQFMRNCYGMTKAPVFDFSKTTNHFNANTMPFHGTNIVTIPYVVDLSNIANGATTYLVASQMVFAQVILPKNATNVVLNNALAFNLDSLTFMAQNAPVVTSSTITMGATLIARAGATNISLLTSKGWVVA